MSLLMTNYTFNLPYGVAMARIWLQYETIILLCDLSKCKQTPKYHNCSYMVVAYHTF